VRIPAATALVLLVGLLVQIYIQRLQTFTIPHVDCPAVRYDYCDGRGYAFCPHGELLLAGYTR